MMDKLPISLCYKILIAKLKASLASLYSVEAAAAVDFDSFCF